jgi:hypothetical protein
MCNKYIIIMVVIIICIIFIANNVAFPLSAGDSSSGKQAVKNLHSYPNNNNSKKTLSGVIVEPRTENLVFIIKHYIHKLPRDSYIQVFHGNLNKTLLENEFKKEINNGKIELLNMGIDNLTIQGYSYLLTSPVFWNKIKTNNILIFQTDSITCSQSSQDLESFYNYDFIGAPPPIYICYMLNILFLAKGTFVGSLKYFNGGLSFRKKDAMLNVLKEYIWDELTPEDVWFCAFLNKQGANLPSRETAQLFSFESDKITDIPWGLHKPRKEFEKLNLICPEVKEIPTIESHTDYRNLYLL